MIRSRPRVGISRCLLGDEVRYDGTHKRSEHVIETLEPHVEWVAVCPEVEIGMGTPREPIELVIGADGVPSAGFRVRLVGVQRREDWTERMQAWARARVRALEPLGLSGYVFKARSPSCGIDDVRVAGTAGTARGLFAQALIDAMPELPVADEERLGDAGTRASFLARVLAYRGQTPIHGSTQGPESIRDGGSDPVSR